MTTRVILDYVEREGGRPAVRALLEGAGLLLHPDHSLYPAKPVRREAW